MVQLQWKDELGAKPGKRGVLCTISYIGWVNLPDTLIRTVESMPRNRIRNRGGHTGFWSTQKNSLKTCFWSTFSQIFSLVAFLLQASILLQSWNYCNILVEFFRALQVKISKMKTEYLEFFSSIDGQPESYLCQCGQKWYKRTHRLSSTNFESFWKNFQHWSVCFQRIETGNAYRASRGTTFFKT